MISRITIDNNDIETDLCRLGWKYGTDMSPLNQTEGEHCLCRHSYTPILSLLFEPLRHKNINLAEFGIYKCASIKMWLEYFSDITIHGFDYERTYLKAGELMGLPNTHFHEVDVRTYGSIKEALVNTPLFDIIIDDASHGVDSQVRLLKAAVDKLVPGGIVITQDIYNDDRSPEERFEEVVKKYSFATFIYPKDNKAKIGGWNNEKLLYLVK